MKILFVTSEVVPFCKTGGLADVCGSLPQALAKGGDEVAVMLPLYQVVGERFRGEMTFVRYCYVRLAWRNLYCGVFRLERDGVSWYFIDNEQYFKRDELYGYYDDGERFAYFCRAVMELLPKLPWKPQVVHCNDWQTGLLPVYIRDEAARNPFYRDIRTVVTVHNIEYQGRFGSEVLGDLFGLPVGWMADGTMNDGGDVSILKGALLAADAITTVSPTYAQELRSAEFAHGLEGTVARCATKLHGVLNGIDMERYDPRVDAQLSAHYAANDLTGKAADKAALQARMGLAAAPDKPLIAMVSRLVGHKGLDLVCAALEEMMRTDAQLVVLGKGEAQYEDFFYAAQEKYPGRVAFYEGYSEELAMAIYGGADLFLMPSKSEPCGLSQMIAMRYGTVPIVRETGGLRDTVQPYESWCGAGNGFTFAPYHVGDMLHVLREAVSLYHDDPAAFTLLRQRGMEADFSWTASAKAYHDIYEEIATPH